MLTAASAEGAFLSPRPAGRGYSSNTGGGGTPESIVGGLDAVLGSLTTDAPLESTLQLLDQTVEDAARQERSLRREARERRERARNSSVDNKDEAPTTAEETPQDGDEEQAFVKSLLATSLHLSACSRAAIQAEQPRAAEDYRRAIQLCKEVQAVEEVVEMMDEAAQLAADMGEKEDAEAYRAIQAVYREQGRVG